MTDKNPKIKILILGGYGNFGKRITENLATLPNLLIVIAGRNIKKAEKLIATIEKNTTTTLSAIKIDCESAKFTENLKSLNPNLVIHTCGPFQGQGYQVAKASIEAGSHYIDLADDRRFVCDFSELSEEAEKNNVLLVSGASTVPGLSSVVVDHFQKKFKTIETIDMAIAPGNKAERGEATIHAILSYTGKPFKALVNGQWRKLYGWMNSRRINFGGFIGKRWLANVDVPELELFPQRYKGVKTVKFQAGLELTLLHWVMVKMAYLTKLGIINNWGPAAKMITRLSNLFHSFGTDQGGMRVTLQGTNSDGKKKTLIWTLFADNGIGPYIPTISTIILARRLISGDLKATGAKPCLGMYSLDEFTKFCEVLDIHHSVEIEYG